MTDELLDRWCALLTAAGAAAPAEQVRRAGAELLDRWAEPHRAYHDVEHLTEVLARLDQVGAEAAPADARLAELAAWWHDAVYDPTRGDNEERSADLAAAALSGLGLDGPAVAEVRRLVAATADHASLPGTPAGAMLADADLGVLASPPDRYARYADGVRREYAHVDDQAFRLGRAAVLRFLRDRPELFATAHGRDRWEAAARRNIDAELAALAVSRPGGGAGRPPAAG